MGTKKKRGPLKPPLCKKAIAKAIEICGSQSEFARKCGVEHQRVQHWRKNGVSAHHVATIVKATDGQVRPEELRPDLYAVFQKAEKLRSA